MRTVTDEERRARFAARHLLLAGTRTDDVTAVADALVALHSSDPVTVHLSVLARMHHPSLAAVETALYEDRTLVRHHAMRRTLWVATPEVVRVLHAAATLALVGPDRRRTAGYLAAGGVADPGAWLDDADARVLADLAVHGPSTARELGQRIEALRQPIVVGGPRWGATQSAHTRVLLGLGLAGEIVRTRPLGSWVSGAYRYALAGTWVDGGLGSLDGLHPREARAALARRYLQRFGPATTEDLRWWAGWPVTATRTALADVGPAEVDLDGGPAWVLDGDEAGEDPGPWVAALPGLDPTTMGWKRRTWYLPDAAADAFDRNGNAGPTLWVDGRVVGAWAQASDGRMLTHYFERVDPVRRAELDERLASLSAATGEARWTVRFPGRVDARVRAGAAEDDVADRPVRLQPLARARVLALGDVGRRWHDGLPALLQSLASDWSLTLLRPLPGGSASYVVGARTASGAPVVVKVAMADPGFGAEVDLLRAADGRGYARLLEHDPARGAVLLERLGPALGGSGLDVEQQLDALAATLLVAWRRPDRPVTERARALATGIQARRHLALPAESAAVERALAHAEELSAAPVDDPVLVHGDPHPGNLLRVAGPRPGAPTGWCLVDPEPCVTDAAYDLGVTVRDFSATLLAEPSRAVGRLRGWCRRVAAPSGTDPDRVWAWGYLERVSTGLYVRSFGAPAVAEPFLRSAALLAET